MRHRSASAKHCVNLMIRQADKRTGNNRAAFRPVVFLRPRIGWPVDPDWFAQLRQAFPESRILAPERLARQWQVQPALLNDASLSAIAGACRPGDDEHGILILTVGMHIPPLLAPRLALAAAEPDCQLLALAGNHDGRVNPLAGVDLAMDELDVDALTALCGEASPRPISDFPDTGLLLAGSWRKNPPARPTAALIDTLFIRDPDQPINQDRAASPASRAALGQLRRRLLRLIEHQVKTLPRIGHDRQPVTLHISHNWGGGIARWISDICEADDSGHHLVLAAAGERRGREHGQWLNLYAGGPGRGLIRRFSLLPAIGATAIRHAQYRQILDWIIARYSVGRILVSSLIGHSLEALSRPLPTAIMLHDYYPVWPLLDIDPLDWLTRDDRLRLKEALDGYRGELLFDIQHAGTWRQLGQQWLKTVTERQLPLIAPSREVAGRWHRLTRRQTNEPTVIPHGFRGWAGKPPKIKAPPLKGRRLHLVVVGRLSAGKGLGLLENALPELSKQARITLVGCGRHGHRLFGKPGVDVILDYRRDELPELLAGLAPDAALFLSTVPETWNFVLSETRSLGLVPIATDLGSFRERIRHGHDGLLFAPEPKALITTIRDLKRSPGQLAEMRKRLPEEPIVETVLTRYWQHLAPDEPTEGTLPTINCEADLGLLAATVADQRLTLAKLQLKLDHQQTEIDARTDWAQRQERLSLERTEWARSLQRDLDTASDELQRLQSLIQDHEAELESRARWAREQEALAAERTAWAHKMAEEVSRSAEQVSQLMTRLEERESELARRTEWARSQEKLLLERTAWAQDLDKELKRVNKQVQAFEKITVRLQDELDQRREQAERLTAEIVGLTAEVERQQQSIQALEQRAHHWQEQYDSLSADYLEQSQQLENQSGKIALLERQLADTRAWNEQLVAERETMLNSRSWRLTRPLRFVNRLLANAHARRAWNPLRWPRLVGRLAHFLRLYGLRRTLTMLQLPEAPATAAPQTIAAPPPPPTDEQAQTLPEPVRLDPADRPTASIIVPVYNKVGYTAACLHSLAEHAGSTEFEVIVVDDCSSDNTQDYLETCEGITVLRQPENAGFIASCNAGAGSARGQYLVFLNNDTTVTAGWLEALLSTFDQFEQAGVVGARLIYPDNTLQEAGGIIFSDGSGWNYGRNDNPDRPEYNFACEADYVSGACLAIRRSDFEQLEGFDDHYTPAYYEDTDLCFRIRQIGKQVIYQPACTIHHHEGISSGTDLSSGTKRYQAVNREKFLARWRQALAGQPAPVAGLEAVEEVRQARHFRSHGHLLVIDATTPTPDQDSGSVRMQAILEIAREMGWRVSFMPENLAWVDGYSQRLQAAGIEFLHAPWIERAESWLAVHGHQLDAIVVSRHYVLAPLLPLIKQYAPRARLIFDTVDLHFLREEREAEFSGTPTAARAAAETRRQELKMMAESDLTVVVSPVEKSLLAEIAPEVDVRILSNIHSVRNIDQGWAERSDLMFVGGFQHPPNLDAAQWLIQDIFPRIRSELPEVILHLIGSKMPPELLEINAPGIRIHGFVPDIDPYLAGCRVSLAPLRYGAGVKGKVNQAMAFGLPVVATACAAEGMFLKHGEDVMVADSAKQFAEQVVRVYNNKALWERLSRGGQANVERYFSRQAARRAMIDLLGEC